MVKVLDEVLVKIPVEVLAVDVVQVLAKALAGINVADIHMHVTTKITIRTYVATVTELLRMLVAATSAMTISSLSTTVALMTLRSCPTGLLSLPILALPAVCYALLRLPCPDTSHPVPSALSRHTPSLSDCRSSCYLQSWPSLSCPASPKPTKK